MSTERPIRVVLADDHPVVRLGIRNVLMAEPGIEVVAEACDGQSALDATRSCRPDVLVLDLAMPRLSGLEVLRELKRLQLSAKTVLLTGTVEKQELVEAIQLGVRGVVLKDSAPQDIRQAVRTVSSGHVWFSDTAVNGVIDVLRGAGGPAAQRENPFGLTARECEIVSAVVDGCTNKDVAAKLEIAEDTVKRHITNIFNKLGMSTRLELAMFAVSHSLVTTPGKQQ
jgi:two-component system, NarL family, nitrate/nitrite response regulator NarL